MNGKHIGIIAAVLAASGTFWFFAARWVASATLSLDDTIVWGVPLLALFLFCAVSGLAFMFLQEKRWRLAVAAAMSAPLIFVIGLWSVESIGIIVVLFLMQWYAGSRIADELTARTTIRAKRIIGAGIAPLMTAALLAVSFVYYGTPDVQSSASRGQLPPAVTRAVQTAARQVAAVQFASLSPTQRLQAENEVVRIVLSQLNAWIRPYVRYLPPLLAFGLFLVLQAFSFIFIPLSLLVAAGLFALLRRATFVTIQTKDMKAEVLSL